MASRFISPLQNCLTPISLFALMVSSKVHLPFSQNCPPPMTCSQRTIWNTPCTNYISFQFKNMLLLSHFQFRTFVSIKHIARISFLLLLELICHSSINIWIVTFSLQLLQNIFITYKSHGYHTQFVLANWIIHLLGG